MKHIGSAEVGGGRPGPLPRRRDERWHVQSRTRDEPSAHGRCRLPPAACWLLIPAVGFGLRKRELELVCDGSMLLRCLLRRRLPALLLSRPMLLPAAPCATSPVSSLAMPPHLRPH